MPADDVKYPAALNAIAGNYLPCCLIVIEEDVVCMQKVPDIPAHSLQY